MDATMVLEHRPHSAVRLRLTVPAAEVDRVYCKIKDKYSREIQLPGFRRGKVPTALMEKKFGEALQREALQEVLHEALTQKLPEAEAQPLPYDTPRLVNDELNLKLGSDLLFTVEYDTFPHFVVPEYRGVEVTQPQVTVTEEDVARNLEDLREQNSVVVNKSKGGAAEGDVVTLDFHEVDEDGRTVEGSHRQDFVMTLGKTDNLYHFDRELTGLKAGEERSFVKDYPSDFPHAELAGTTKNLYVKVKALKTMELPELDDDFAQDISEKFQTLQDLKNDMRRSLEEKLAEKLEDLQLTELLDKLLEKTPIDLPESMVQVDLGKAWEKLAEQNRFTPEQLDKVFSVEKKTQILDAWRPGAETHLRRQLVLETLEKKLDFKVTQESEAAEIERLAGKFQITVEETREYYSNKGMLDALRRDLARKNTVRTLLAGVKVKRGPKMSFRELIDCQAQKG